MNEFLDFKWFDYTYRIFLTELGYYNQILSRTEILEFFKFNDLEFLDDRVILLLDKIIKIFLVKIES